MVDVRPKSAKLRDRAKRIVMHIAGVSEEKAAQLLEQSGWEVKTSIVMEKKGLSLEDSRELLDKHNGFLREALK
jgi:N-acetylmuramic acid 6-phosphate etherase